MVMILKMVGEQKKCKERKITMSNKTKRLIFKILVDARDEKEALINLRENGFNLSSEDVMELKDLYLRGSNTALNLLDTHQLEKVAGGAIARFERRLTEKRPNTIHGQIPGEADHAVANEQIPGGTVRAVAEKLILPRLADGLIPGEAEELIPPREAEELILPREADEEINSIIEKFREKFSSVSNIEDANELVNKDEEARELFEKLSEHIRMQELEVKDKEVSEREFNVEDIDNVADEEINSTIEKFREKFSSVSNIGDAYELFNKDEEARELFEKLSEYKMQELEVNDNLIKE